MDLRRGGAASLRKTRVDDADESTVGRPVRVHERVREDVARNLLQSIGLLASASRLLADKCVSGIEANRERNEEYAEGTLSAATALNPYIGYDKAAEIVKEAASSGRSLREVAREAGVEESVLDEALDYHAMARPHG